ncbi:MAG TPA: NUDIX domain-containing protein, partial [Qipengyuania sp.]|nr:NUDIX domain-containing protein [Qipengyuania sp.]
MIDRFYRIAFNVAHKLRHRWRRWRKVQLEGVTMIARNLQGDLLLVRLSYAGVGWSLPGGGANRGEAMEAAA